MNVSSSGRLAEASWIYVLGEIGSMNILVAVGRRSIEEATN